MINRELQKELLLKLKACYLGSGSFKLKDLVNSDEKQEVEFNLKYLKGHGLIKSYNWSHAPINIGWVNGSPARPAQQPVEAISISGEITVKGIDFLEDDGGCRPSSAP